MKVEQIKELISKAEIENAKSQGVIENIKDDWKEKYGTDNPEEIKQKLQELKEEKEKTDERKEKLQKELNESYDWEELEEELA